MISIEKKTAKIAITYKNDSNEKISTSQYIYI